MARARAWTWTLNNYTAQELTHLETLSLAIGSKGIKYLCYGKEVGSEGTPHLQGYTYLNNPVRMSTMKTLLGSIRIHLESSKGSSQQNRLYCQKRDERSIQAGVPPNEFFVEFGEIPQQGKRKDLDAVKEMIDNGATEVELAQSHFSEWIHHRVGFREYRNLTNRTKVTPTFSLASFPVTWQNTVFDWTRTMIFHGSSGSGKTEFACAVLPGALMVSHMDDLKTFDPSFHTGIIFDDVDINHYPRNGQIHIVDQVHDRSIHVRYSTALIPKGTKKIFTTNEERGTCMNTDDPAIKRRIQIHHFERDWMA